MKSSSSGAPDGHWKFTAARVKDNKGTVIIHSGSPFPGRTSEGLNVSELTSYQDHWQWPR